VSSDENHGVGLGPIDVPDYLRPTYANYVNVNHTPWDVRLMFALVKAPMPGAEQDAAVVAQAIRPEAVAEIILPANLMHGFISALQENFSNYLTSYGPPGLDPEGPRGTGPEDE
jgi:Protein of unknown function (DUF3467)